MLTKLPYFVLFFTCFICGIVATVVSSITDTIKHFGLSSYWSKQPFEFCSKCSYGHLCGRGARPNADNSGQGIWDKFLPILC